MTTTFPDHAPEGADNGANSPVVEGLGVSVALPENGVIPEYDAVDWDVLDDVWMCFARPAGGGRCAATGPDGAGAVKA
jgi:hypothetical protein